MAKQAKRQLAGSGEALPAGAIGEARTAISAAPVPLTGNAFTQVASITLSTGIWLVRGAAMTYSIGVSFSDFNVACVIGSAVADLVGNFGTGTTKKYQMRTAGQVNPSTVINIEEFATTISSFVVKSDGTNLRFADDVVLASGSQTLVLACYIGGYTAGTPTGSGTIEAVRIA